MANMVGMANITGMVNVAHMGGGGGGGCWPIIMLFKK